MRQITINQFRWQKKRISREGAFVTKGMLFAHEREYPTMLFANTTPGGIMGIESSVAALREQAMEALKESTTMLEVASNLLDAGNREEAIRLKDEARGKRNVSVWLMSKANTLDNDGSGNPRFQVHENFGTTSH